MVDRVLDEALKIATENQLLKAMLRKMVGQDDLSPWGYRAGSTFEESLNGVMVKREGLMRRLAWTEEPTSARTEDSPK